MSLCSPGSRWIVLGAVLMVAAGCRAAPTSLMKAGEVRAAQGDHAQAYVDYRAALYYEVPPHSAMAGEVRAAMAAALAALVEARVRDARAALGRGDADGALDVLAPLLAEDLGKGSWETAPLWREGAPRLNEAQRARVLAELAAVDEVYWRQVEALAAADTYVPAVARAARFARAVPPEHEAQVRLRALRRRGAEFHEAKARARRSPIAAGFHRLLAARLRQGTAPALAAAPVVWELRESGNPECALERAAARAQLPSGDRDRVVVTVKAERCVRSEERWRAREDYDYFVKELREEIRIVRKGDCDGFTGTRINCVTHPNGTSSCGEISDPTLTCTPDITRKELREVSVRKTAQRDVDYLRIRERWEGTVEVASDLVTTALPFVLDEEMTDTAYSTEHGSKSMTLDERQVGAAVGGKLAALLKGRVEAEVRKARSAKAVELAQAAGQRGQGADEEHWYVVALAWWPAAEAAEAFLIDRYGLERQLTTVLMGSPDSVPTWAAVLPAQTSVPAPFGCPSCYAHRTTEVAGAVSDGGEAATGGNEGMGALVYLRGGDAERVPDLASQLTLSMGWRARPDEALTMAWVVDLEVGGGLSGGFAYGLHLLPLGIGGKLGPVRVGLAGGAGFAGVSGRVPISLRAPVEAYWLLDLSEAVALSGAGRVAFVSTDRRHDGAARAPVGDELDLWLGLRLGQLSWGEDGASNYFVGGFYREVMGTWFAGVGLGVGGFGR